MFGVKISTIWEHLGHTWNQHFWIFQNWKISCKSKNSLTGDQMPYLGVLGINFEKLFLFMKSALSNLSYCKFWCKKKNSLILDQKYVACVFLDKNFKNHCHIWIQILWVCQKWVCNLRVNFSIGYGCGSGSVS